MGVVAVSGGSRQNDGGGGGQRGVGGGEGAGSGRWGGAAERFPRGEGRAPLWPAAAAPRHATRRRGEAAEGGRRGSGRPGHGCACQRRGGGEGPLGGAVPIDLPPPLAHSGVMSSYGGHVCRPASGPRSAPAPPRLRPALRVPRMAATQVTGGGSVGRRRSREWLGSEGGRRAAACRCAATEATEACAKTAAAHDPSGARPSLFPLGWSPTPCARTARAVVRHPVGAGTRRSYSSRTGVGRTEARHRVFPASFPPSVIHPLLLPQVLVPPGSWSLPEREGQVPAARRRRARQPRLPTRAPRSHLRISTVDGPWTEGGPSPAGGLDGKRLELAGQGPRGSASARRPRRAARPDHSSDREKQLFRQQGAPALPTTTTFPPPPPPAPQPSSPHVGNTDGGCRGSSRRHPVLRLATTRGGGALQYPSARPPPLTARVGGGGAPRPRQRLVASALTPRLAGKRA